MSEFLGSQDIYNELVENPENSWILGLVAFAVIEEQRIEWMKHKQQNTSHLPTHTEIENWYREQPKSILLRAKDTAEARLKDYSAEAISEFENTYCDEIKNSIVISEIKNNSKFLPQFGINLLGGITSSIIFSALLLFLLMFLIKDPSITKLLDILDKHNTQQTYQENHNAK